jgi:hypothetical protein
MSDGTIHFLLFQDCLIRVSDNWAILDRIIHEVPAYLKSQGRLAFTWFGFRGVTKALQDLHAAGLEARILFRERKRIPRIARERPVYILDRGPHPGHPGRPRLALGSMQRESTGPPALVGVDREGDVHFGLTNVSGVPDASALFLYLERRPGAP